MFKGLEGVVISSSALTSRGPRVVGATKSATKGFIGY